MNLVLTVFVVSDTHHEPRMNADGVPGGAHPRFVHGHVPAGWLSGSWLSEITGNHKIR